MTMIEKVARAMAEATEKMLPVRVWQSWDEMSTPAKAAYVVRARVAIEAMMEPDEHMIEAGSDARQPGNSRWGNSTKTWSAMIKAALDQK